MEKTVGNVDKKCHISGLVTTTVLNTKIGEVENTRSCDLVTTTILNIKIGEVENKIPDVSGQGFQFSF